MPRNVNPLVKILVTCASIDPTRLAMNGIFWHAQRGYWLASDGRRMFATKLLPAPRQSSANSVYKPKPLLDGDEVPWPESGEWCLPALEFEHAKELWPDGKPMCLTRIPEGTPVYRWHIPPWIALIEKASRWIDGYPTMAFRPQPEIEAIALLGEKTTVDTVQMSSNKFRFVWEKEDPVILNLANLAPWADDVFYLHLRPGCSMAWLTVEPHARLWEQPSFVLVTACAMPKAGFRGFVRVEPSTKEQNP